MTATRQIGTLGDMHLGVAATSATAAPAAGPRSTRWLRARTLLVLLIVGPALFSLDVLRARALAEPHAWGSEVAAAIALAFLAALLRFGFWIGAALLLYRLLGHLAPTRPRLRALLPVALAGSGLALVASALFSLTLQPLLRPALLAALPAGSARALAATRAAIASSWAALTSEVSTSFVMSLPWDLLASWAVVAAVALTHFSLAARDRERAALALERQVSEAHLAALEAQLRPHFLFNALNTVAAELARAPAAAQAVATSLARLFERLLGAEAPSSTRLGAEIALCEDYLQIERARFGERLRVQITIGPGCEAAVIPSLLVQPLVENAVRHAVAARVAPVTITLRAWRTGAALCLLVEDDGPGCAPPTGAGIGIANTRDRLAARYGAQQSFALEGHGPSGGVRVRLSLPFTTELPAVEGPGESGQDPPARHGEPAPGGRKPPPTAPASESGVLVLGWALFALAMIVLNVVWCSARHLADIPQGLTFLEKLAVGSRGAVAWILLYPPVAWFTARVAGSKLTPVSRLLAHAAFAPVVALAKAILIAWLQHAIGGPLAEVPIAALLVGRIHSDILHYAVMVGLATTLLLHARQRAHARAAARLEAELAAARLAALRIKLEPTFIQKTLAGLGPLCTSAPLVAEALVARTGDLLRQLLRERHTTHVPLADEVTFMSTLLAIEALRATQPTPPPFTVPEAIRHVPVPVRCLALPLLRDGARDRYELAFTPASAPLRLELRAPGRLLTTLTLSP